MFSQSSSFPSFPRFSSQSLLSSFFSSTSSSHSSNTNRRLDTFKTCSPNSLLSPLFPDSPPPLNLFLPFSSFLHLQLTLQRQTEEEKMHSRHVLPILFFLLLFQILLSISSFLFVFPLSSFSPADSSFQKNLRRQDTSTYFLTLLSLLLLLPQSLLLSLFSRCRLPFTDKQEEKR